MNSKTINTILLIKKEIPQIGIKSLYQAMFLIDVEHFKKTCRKVTAFDYHMCDSELSATLSQIQLMGSTGTADLALFSKREIKIISSISQNPSRLNISEIHIENAFVDFAKSFVITEEQQALYSDYLESQSFQRALDGM